MDCTTKRCTKCGITKLLTEFSRRPERPSEYRSDCKACFKLLSDRWRERRLKREKIAPPDTKTCKHCGETKPSTEYTRYSQSIDGLRPWCKACIVESNRQHRVTYPERVKAASMRWRLANLEHYKAMKREEYQKNKEYYHLRHVARYAANRQAHIDKAKAYAKTPRGIIRARLAANKRRALTKGGDLTIEQTQNLMERQKRCAYCKKLFTKKRPATIDHVVPLSKGGLHTLSNVVLACKSCNSSKYNSEIYLL